MRNLTVWAYRIAPRDVDYVEPPPPSNARDSLLSQPSFAPYTDDPEQGFGVEEPATMLQTQRLIMDGAFTSALCRSVLIPLVQNKTNNSISCRIRLTGNITFRCK